MLIDAHVHLDQYPAERIDSYIREWQAAGVERIVAVSTNLASAYRTLAWKAKYPRFIYAAIGYHPEQELPTRQELNELFSLLTRERHAISAIGEVGLPYYTLAEREAPQQALEASLELLHMFAQQAREKNLPLLLHAVHDQVPIVLNLLLEYEIKKAHFHWLKATADVVQDITAAGYYISVTPEVCYRKRDQLLAKQVPLENLLLETDGPWPYKDRFANRSTTPLFIQDVARTVAQLKHVEKNTLLQQCQQNINQLLGQL